MVQVPPVGRIERMPEVPKIPHHLLVDICATALRAAGASDPDATLVADHLVENDRIGHHSHGVIRLREYVDAIDRGELIPGAQPRILSESTSTAQVDGGWTFGQVVAEFATDLAIRKARSCGISSVTMRRVKHIGRLGRYAEKVVENDLVSIIFTCGGGHGINQAPFGGVERRLNSNPIAMSFPSGLEGPYLLDMATSVVAEGKVRMHRARGARTPAGWIVDSRGKPTTDPNDFYEGGAILPLGGDEGHKGYALAFMVDLFGGILSRGGVPGDPTDSFSNDSMIIVLDPQCFVPLEEAKRRASVMTEHIKGARRRDRARAILYPGEIEATARAASAGKPIEVVPAVWEGVQSVLEQFSIPIDRWELAVEDSADSADSATQPTTRGEKRGRPTRGGLRLWKKDRIGGTGARGVLGSSSSNDNSPSQFKANALHSYGRRKQGLSAAATDRHTVVVTVDGRGDRRDRDTASAEVDALDLIRAVGTVCDPFLTATVTVRGSDGTVSLDSFGKFCTFRVRNYETGGDARVEIGAGKVRELFLFLDLIAISHPLAGLDGSADASSVPETYETTGVGWSKAKLQLVRDGDRVVVTGQTDQRGIKHVETVDVQLNSLARVTRVAGGDLPGRGSFKVMRGWLRFEHDRYAALKLYISADEVDGAAVIIFLDMEQVQDLRRLIVAWQSLAQRA